LAELLSKNLDDEPNFHFARQAQRHFFLGNANGFGNPGAVPIGITAGTFLA
jgi:hypothetical protein